VTHNLRSSVYNQVRVKVYYHDLVDLDSKNDQENDSSNLVDSDSEDKDDEETETL
jgi:hypothetical protein